MANWKKYIPTAAKVFIKVTQQRCNDLFSKQKFASQKAEQNNFLEIVSIQQSVNVTATSFNKIHNLSVAINALNNIIIAPGQTFSFWKLVGAPSKKNGYKKSRSIINGELEAAIGGGLCQLSGLIYFLAIRSGLTITERHAHSIDIYTEAERFTPLGSDATVAYGYKDLRFINNFDCPIILQLHLSNHLLVGSIAAAEAIQPKNISFEYAHTNLYIDVATIVVHEEHPVTLFTNRYKLLTANT